MSDNLPTKFDGNELRAFDIYQDGTPEEIEHYEKTGRFIADKTPKDWKSLQAYLASMKLEWVIDMIHDEPCGAPGLGGLPRIRVQGSLKGNGVKFGKFEIAFNGRRIDVKLDETRQKLFAEAMAELESRKVSDEMVAINQKMIKQISEYAERNGLTFEQAARQAALVVGGQKIEPPISYDPPKAIE